MPAPADRPGALVTGVGGYLGSYVAELLLDQGYAVSGTLHRNQRLPRDLANRLLLLQCDLRDREQVANAVLKARPELIFHLAAQSLPVLSWKEPETTFAVNVLGTLHLLDSVRTAGLHPRILMAGSSAEYGPAAADELPIREDKRLQPTNPYGVSKMAAGALARVYAKAHGLEIIWVRPFFIIGPRKTGDMCSDFARGVVAVERGEREALGVGNLETVRDFLDVRDAARAMVLLAERGEAGEAYNLCSGNGRAVREALDMLLSLAAMPVRVEPDPARLRPADDPMVIGDNARLRALGWEPQIPFERTLADVLAYWRTPESCG